MKPVIKITDLHVNYETSEETVKAVNGISFEVYKGETLGIVGETGAGKTTTALSIMKLLPEPVGKIKKGQIEFNGKRLDQASELDMLDVRGGKISMIFQDPMTSLNPVLTIEDQIDEVIGYHTDLDSVARSKRVDEMLELVGISPKRKGEYPHQFSGGMKQRVVIAMALACDPELLIADEPTTALDVTIQAQVLDMMTELKEKLSTATILITHDLGVVAQTCDTVAITYAGEVIEYGTLEDVFGGDDHHQYTIGLFGSIPNLKSDVKRLTPIPGLMPDPANLPEGCKFHTRCPKCMPICKSSDPAIYQMGTHKIKCHLFKEGREVV